MELSEQPAQTKVKETEQHPPEDNGFINRSMLDNLDASGNNPLIPLAKVTALKARQAITLKEVEKDVVSISVSETVLARMNIVARSPVIQKLWYASTGLPTSEEELSDERLVQTNWQQKERNRVRALYHQQRAMLNQKKVDGDGDLEAGEEIKRDIEESKRKLEELEQQGIKPFTPKEIENIVKFEAALRSHSF